MASIDITVQSDMLTGSQQTDSKGEHKQGEWDDCLGQSTVEILCYGLFLPILAAVVAQMRIQRAVKHPGLVDTV